MKRFLAFLCASVMIVLSSCSKEDQTEKVDMSLLPGTWVESYPDDPYFVLDSYVTYTLDGNGGCEVYVDAMGDKVVTSTDYYTYSLDGNVITLNPTQEGTSRSYNVIKLDSKNMVWLKVGFKEPEASLAADLKKFARK